MNIYVQKFSEKYPDIDLTDYFRFVSENKLPNKTKFKTSHHHILPRWAFPEYSDLKIFGWNGAHLTHDNHLKAHIILAKLWVRFENTNAIVRIGDNTLTDELLLDFQKQCEINNLYVANNNSIKNKEKVNLGIHNFQQESHKKLVSELQKELVENAIHNFSSEVIFEKTGCLNYMMLPEVKQKSRESNKNTLLERYNVEHNWSIPGIVKSVESKKLKTMVERYGVEYLSQLPENKEKAKLEWQENNPMSREEGKKNHKTSMLKNHGVEYPAQNPDIAKKIVETRRKNELNRPKIIWIKHIENKWSTSIREDIFPEYEKYGFVKGRGVKGYTPPPNDLFL